LTYQPLPSSSIRLPLIRILLFPHPISQGLQFRIWLVFDRGPSPPFSFNPRMPPPSPLDTATPVFFFPGRGRLRFPFLKSRCILLFFFSFPFGISDETFPSGRGSFPPFLQLSWQCRLYGWNLVVARSWRGSTFSFSYPLTRSTTSAHYGATCFLRQCQKSSSFAGWRMKIFLSFSRRWQPFPLFNCATFFSFSKVWN